MACGSAWAAVPTPAFSSSAERAARGSVASVLRK